MEKIIIGKYIRGYDMTPQNRKTKIIHLISNGDVEVLLGVIKWLGSWRQYCFFPETNTLYSNECLKDIKEFLEKLNKEAKNA